MYMQTVAVIPHHNDKPNIAHTLNGKQRDRSVSMDAHFDTTQHEQDEQDENGCWLLDKGKGM